MLYIPSSKIFIAVLMAKFPPAESPTSTMCSPVVPGWCRVGKQFTDTHRHRHNMDTCGCVCVRVRLGVYCHCVHVCVCLLYKCAL